MTRQVVPLVATPSQILSVTLGNQSTQITVYTLRSGLYIDIVNAGAPVVTCRICRNLQYILEDALYQGYQGDFIFVDTQGDTDPEYSGLGSRYLLVYLSQDEFA